MSSLFSDLPSSTHVSNLFYQSSSPSSNSLKPQKSEHVNSAVVLEPAEESDHLEESLHLDALHTDLDRKALIGEKKQKKEAKNKFQSSKLAASIKDRSKESLKPSDSLTKYTLSFPLLPRINSSFDRWDIEGEESKYPYSSSFYYDALEEPPADSLQVSKDDTLSSSHQQLEQGAELQRPKTNSPASLSPFTSRSSAAEETCAAAAGGGGVGPYVPGEQSRLASAHSNKTTSMVRRLTGAGRKRHQQHVLASSALNQHQSTSSSSGRPQAGGTLHLVTHSSRNSRHQPVQARHNQNLTNVDQKQHLRHLLLTAFNKGQKTAATARDICKVYG